MHDLSHTGLDPRVQRAFDMAKQLPTADRVRLRVGVLSGEGVMIAGATLRGFEQAGLLRDQLQILGYTEYLPALGADALGCDLLLKPAGDTVDDSELLRPGSELWPPASGDDMASPQP